MNHPNFALHELSHQTCTFLLVLNILGSFDHALWASDLCCLKKPVIGKDSMLRKPTTRGYMKLWGLPPSTNIVTLWLMMVPKIWKVSGAGILTISLRLSSGGSSSGDDGRRLWRLCQPRWKRRCRHHHQRSKDGF